MRPVAHGWDAEGKKKGISPNKEMDEEKERKREW
jgi:hypothetical protein